MATHVAGRAYSGQVSSLRKISASSTVTLTWTTKHNEDHRDNIPSNIYGLFLKENIMLNNFIVTTWQKGSRQSSCSPTRRANPRPPQTRPLHTVSTRSTFTSSYNEDVYGDEPQLEKKLMVTLRPWTLVRLTIPPGPGQVAKAEQAAAISSTNHFSFKVDVTRKHQDKSMPCNINFWRWSEVRRGVLVVCTWWLSQSSAQTGFMVGQVFPVAPTDQPTRPTLPVRRPADFGNWKNLTISFPSAPRGTSCSHGSQRLDQSN